MIPGKIFTSFAEFQGIVSVNDFRLPIWLQELLQAPLCVLRSFCLARIRLHPLGGQVLHHDCISVIVSRFAIVTEHLVICCYQVTYCFWLRHCVFCKDPWLSWSSWRCRSFGPSGSEYEYRACPVPLSTTAYRSLSRDSLSSVRIWWSAVVTSPTCSALGTTVPVRLLQEALVIFVLKQISQFRSFGKWV